MAALRLSDQGLWTDDETPPPEPPRWMRHAPEVADQLYLHETFRLPPRSRRRAPPAPFSRAWFEQIERQRYSRPGHWIPGVLEFGRHAGETLVGLGDGLGTDWLQYARRGARVIACSPSREQLDLIERHFRVRECEGSFVQAPPHALPLDTASIDVVCVQGLLTELADPALLIDEIYRVLRPGGKVIAVTPARFDAAYWQDRILPWRRWFRKSTPTSPAATTARELKRDFARFADLAIKKRHLRRSHLPQIWRPFPLPLLERFLGQSLILKAFKPLNASLVQPVAA